MPLELVVPATVMRARGYEYRSFKCSSCPWTERRLAFTPQDASSSNETPSSRTVPRSVETPSKDTLARLRNLGPCDGDAAQQAGEKVVGAFGVLKSARA